MTAHAPLKVQIVGHTVFTPPVDVDGNLIFQPDLDTLGVFLPYYNGEALIEFAGRACYQSFHRPNPKTASNADYLLHILQQKHGSVLEHANVSFYLTGVSRSLTHELIRHRHLSFSELSQRFVDVSTARAIVPPLIEKVALTLRETGKLGVDSDTGEEYTVERVLQMAAEALMEDPTDQYSKTVEELTNDAADVGIPVTRKQIRETSRAFLPNATETRMVVTGNYRAWIEVLIKRDNPAADAEIRRMAEEVGRQLARLAPNVFGPKARAEWDHELRNREMTAGGAAQ